MSEATAEVGAAAVKRLSPAKQRERFGTLRARYLTATGKASDVRIEVGSKYGHNFQNHWLSRALSSAGSNGRATPLTRRLPRSRSFSRRSRLGIGRTASLIIGCVSTSRTTTLCAPCERR